MSRKDYGVGDTLLTAAAALGGAILGNGLRLFSKATMLQSSPFLDDDEPDTEAEISITGVVATTVAAAALAHAAGGRRPLYGFLIAAGLGAAVGDVADRMILDLMTGEPEGFVAMEAEEEPDGV